ncbi:MAG: amidohydrolase family protein [Gammaproteobacteria bacterium]|nr:MAG: amidohydrolase family protein [Gammaproteobacteria bacterium]TDJ40214.1 MAG: amidohydrolase family protein [Gammaproteobacteria bacterium]
MRNQFLLTDVRLFAGVSDEVIDHASVWIDGRMIRFAGPSCDLPEVPGDVPRLDLNGRFVMPGMTESHAHLSYTNNGPTELDKTAVEPAMVQSIANARLMLGSGFTSAISFGSVHRIDVTLRDAIDRGQIPGPRLVASGRDVGATSSNADLHPDHARPQIEGLGMLVDGPWAVRRAVRTLRKNGADIIKLFLDGEGLSDHAPPGELTYTDEEVAAACDEAHRRNMRVACHSRSAAAVKQAVRFGVDVIGHANYLDDEAVEMLKRNRDRLAVGPAIAWEIKLLENCESMGYSRKAVEDKGYAREVDETVIAVRRMKEAGVRVLIGGDYGLNITPHGTYAKDLQYFVELFGMSPAEALLCATRDGGAVADPSGMVGTLEEGKLADLVVVDGDPLADVTVLQDHERLSVIKDGRRYRDLTRDNPYLEPLARGGANESVRQENLEPVLETSG